MRRIPRLPLVLAALALTWTGLAAAAQASSNDPVPICHGTASDTNPYVLISVDENALAGHFDGTEPGHGESNYPDVFPNPDGSCGDGNGGGGEE